MRAPLAFVPPSFLTLLACIARGPIMGQMLGMRQQANQIQSLPSGSLGQGEEMSRRKSHDMKCKTTAELGGMRQRPLWLESVLDRHTSFYCAPFLLRFTDIAFFTNGRFVVTLS